MNTLPTSLRRFALVSAVTFSALSSPLLAQQTYYWDSNGATPGAGITPGGTWGGAGDSGFWSNSANGSAATGTNTGPGVLDTAVFTAFDTTADSPTTGYTVTIGGAESVNGIVIGTSAASTSDGVLTLAGTAGGSLSIGSGGIILNGSSGDPTLAASLGTITLTASQSWVINNAHVLAVQANVAGAATTASTTTLTLGFVGAFTPTISGVISDGTAGGNLALDIDNYNGTSVGGGTWDITGTANTYTGDTIIGHGLVEFNSLANTGVASSLGAGANIDMGIGSNSATLDYIGSAASTSNRTINITGSNVTIENNAGAATSSLTLTGNNTNTTTSTLTFSGSNTGSNTFSGTLSDSSGVLNINKTGTGTWYLSGNETISGNISVSAGALVMNGGDQFNNVTVSGGTLTLGGANFSFGNYNVTGGTLNINGNNDGANLLSVSGGGLVNMGAGGTVGFGSITLNNGFLQISSGSNVTENSGITIGSSGGGIGVSYTPNGDFPVVTDNSGTTGGVFGIGYSGTGGIGTDPNVSSLFGSSSYWSLGAFTGTTGTYTGTSLPVGALNTYRIGGGGGTLTLQNAILTGAGNSVQIGNPTSGGTVIIPGGETYDGTTTIVNGTASIASGSSFGVGTSAIVVGSGANNVGINYAGAGETFSRGLNFVGTTGTITLSNSGTGNIVYSTTPTFSGSGNKTLALGNATDTFGGSIGAITNGPTGTTSLIETAGNNAVWSLTGGSGNTYTGSTTINSGVLQTTNVTDLANSFVTLNGTSSTSLAIWQTQGTLNTTLGGSGAGVVNWNTFSGFAAEGGALNLTFNGGAQLTWGTGNFLNNGSGTNPLVFGSTTANNQVVLTNAINLNTGDPFNRVIDVIKGTGGDSALLSGVLSNGAGTGAATGITKSGGGTLILSGSNTFSGQVLVSQGTLVAAGNSAAAGATTVGVLGSGFGPSTNTTPGLATVTLGDGNTGTSTNPSLLIGGAFTVARPVSALDDGVNNAYSIGGSTASTSTLSGAVTFTNSGGHGNTFNVTQVAGGTFNLTGGLSAGGAGTSTVTFANTGAVNVITTAITNGGGTVAVTQSGTGTTTLGTANTYTGATTISAGQLLFGNNNSAQTSVVTVNSNNGLAFATGVDAVTIAGLAGSGNFVLQDAGNAAVALTFGNTLGQTYSGAMSGTGSIVKLGTGTETLAGANTYNGSTQVSAGTLQVGNGTSGSIGNTATTISSGAAIAFNMATGSTFSGALVSSGTVTGAESSGVTNTLSGNISGSSGFTQSGAGETILSGSNSFTGTTTVTTGTLAITGTTTSMTTLTAGTLIEGGVNNSTGADTVTTGTVIFNSATALGTGTTTVSSTGWTIDSTVAGVTTSGGQIRLTGATATPGSTTFLGTQSLNIGNSIFLTGGDQQITVNANTLTLSGAVTNNRNIIKAGSGTLVLSGINTFGMGTTTTGVTINAGYLEANTTGSANSATGIGKVLINSGGNLGGTGFISGATTLSSGGGINLNDGVLGTLTINNILTTTGGGALTFEIGAGSLGTDQLALGTTGNSFAASGVTNINIDNLAGVGSLSLNTGTYTLVTYHGTQDALSDFNLNTTSLDGKTFQLSETGDVLSLIVSGGSATPGTSYYFTGSNSGSFTDAGNYFTAASGGTSQTGNALSSTSNVYLNATSPTPANTPDTLNTIASINSLNFVTAGTTLAGSGTLTLAASGTAGITDSGSTAGQVETVAPAIVLGSNQSWAATANSTLNVTGPISGAQTLLLTGAGTYKLGGANTFSGLTVGSGSDTPTVYLTNGTNGSATGTTTLAVSAGATLGGNGTSSGTSFSISGTGTATGARANLLVGLTSATDTNTTNVLTLKGTAASTIQNANLTFNINQGSVGQGTELNVGSTLVTFGSGAKSTTLTLDLQGNGIIPANSPYVLIAGSTTGGADQYSGLNLGTSTVNGNVTITQILSSGSAGTGDLTLAFAGGTSSFYSPNSYLFLYQNSLTGADDIEVEVVPEPGTWALMLGGLAMLIFWQRRRARRD